MSKIIVSISKNNNYIYHMMSVSKCGYDNEYGEKHKNIHNKIDLEILKTNENLLTAVGGSHFGKLYSVLVSTPAAIEEEHIFLNYLEGIKDLFLLKNPVINFDKYRDTYQIAYEAHEFIVTEQSSFKFYNSLKEIKKPIINICDVLINNYALYDEFIWKKTQQELEPKMALMSKYLSLDIELEWERIIGHTYPHGKFEVLLCNSISGGSQAIDIAYNKDVFGTDVDIETIVQYISHEFGIFVLRDKMDQEKDIEFHSNYDVIETVIEYFNPVKYNKLVFGEKFNTILSQIEDLVSMEPSLSLIEIINILKN